GVLKALLRPGTKSGERCYRAPQYLPGGKAVLFTIGRENTDTFDDGQIAVLSLDTGKKKILIEGGMNARYSPTGHLVYARSGGLLAVPFDVKKLTVTGRPFPILDGVFMSVNGGILPFRRRPIAELSGLALITHGLPGEFQRIRFHALVRQNDGESRALSGRA